MSYLSGLKTHKRLTKKQLPIAQGYTDGFNYYAANQKCPEISKFAIGYCAILAALDNKFEKGTTRHINYLVSHWDGWMEARQVIDGPLQEQTK